MGYCPFPALGRDTTGGVATWAAGRAQTRRAATQQLRERHGLGMHDMG